MKDKKITLKKSQSGKRIEVINNGASCSSFESKESRIEKRLKAFRSIVGLWEGKDTSFFDNR